MPLVAAHAIPRLLTWLWCPLLAGVFTCFPQASLCIAPEAVSHDDAWHRRTSHQPSSPPFPAVPGPTSMAAEAAGAAETSPAAAAAGGPAPAAAAATAAAGAAAAAAAAGAAAGAGPPEPPTAAGDGPKRTAAHVSTHHVTAWIQRLGPAGFAATIRRWHQSVMRVSHCLPFCSHILVTLQREGERERESEAVES